MSALGRGARGEAVRELQLLLLMTGMADPGLPDGVFGPLTLEALHGARAALKLPNGDRADEELLHRLRAVPRRRKAIPRVSTPASVGELLAALELGYGAVFGRPANALAVRVAAAQLQLEHGVDLEAIHVHNLGNQDAVRPYQGPYFWLTAPELLEGRWQSRTKPLRAYATREEGAVGYWRRLVEGYAGALWAFERGDPGRAAELLKALRYYTGNPEAYRRAMVDRFRALSA